MWLSLARPGPAILTRLTAGSCYTLLLYNTDPVRLAAADHWSPSTCACAWGLLCLGFLRSQHCRLKACCLCTHAMQHQDVQKHCRPTIAHFCRCIGCSSACACARRLLCLGVLRSQYCWVEACCLHSPWLAEQQRPHISRQHHPFGCLRGKHAEASWPVPCLHSSSYLHGSATAAWIKLQAQFCCAFALHHHSFCKPFQTLSALSVKYRTQP